MVPRHGAVNVKKSGTENEPTLAQVAAVALLETL